jgi:hypothetical protein
MERTSERAVARRGSPTRRWQSARAVLPSDLGVDVVGNLYQVGRCTRCEAKAASVEAAEGGFNLGIACELATLGLREAFQHIRLAGSLEGGCGSVHAPQMDASLPGCSEQIANLLR